jgi:hypothetical protein
MSTYEEFLRAILYLSVAGRRVSDLESVLRSRRFGLTLGLTTLRVYLRRAEVDGIMARGRVRSGNGHLWHVAPKGKWKIRSILGIQPPAVAVAV